MDLTSTPTFEQATPLRGYARMKQLWQAEIDVANAQRIRVEAANFELEMRLKQANITIGELLDTNAKKHAAVQAVPEGFVEVKFTKALGLMIGERPVQYANMRLSNSRKSWGFLNSKNQPVVYIDKETQRGLVRADLVEDRIHALAI